MGSRIVESSSIRFQRRGLYNAAWVKELVTKEKDKIKARDASESKWRHRVSNFADEVIKLTTLMKPVVDIYLSLPVQSTLCLMPTCGLCSRYVRWSNSINHYTKLV